MQLKKYLTNTLWLFIDRILKMVTLFIVGVYVVRYLGPNQYGILSYHLSLVSLFAVFFSLGLNDILVKELVQDTYKESEVLGSGLFLRIFSSVLISIFLILYCWNLPSIQFDILIFILLGYIFQCDSLIAYSYQAKVLSKKVVFCQQITTFIGIFFKIYFVYFEFPLKAFAFVFLLENLLNFIFLVILYTKDYMSPLKWKVNWVLLKSILRRMLPLLFTGIVGSFYLKIDQIMIESYLSVKDVGVYSVCVRLSEVFNFIPMLICSSLYPSLVNAKNIGVIEFEEKMVLLYELLFTISFFISIFIVSFASVIITTIYGVDYSGAILPLQIHIFSAPLLFFIVASDKYLIIEDIIILSFYRGFIGVFANIMLNIYLIPKLGILGASIATVLGYIILILSMLFTKAKGQLLLQLRALFPINIIKLARKKYIYK